MRPQKFHALIALGFTLVAAFGVMRLAHWDWTGWHLLAAWLVGINLTAFGYYAFDKQRAKENGRRVPEVVLHGLSLLGGSLGAFAAMQLFRHKTIKGPFRLLFLGIVLGQVALTVWVVVAMRRI